MIWRDVENGRYPGRETVYGLELETADLRNKGIMPAIESAHAVAGARRLGLRLAETDPDTRPLIVVNLSGRGDKDVDTAMAYFGIRGVADRSTGALK